MVEELTAKSGRLGQVDAAATASQWGVVTRPRRGAAQAIVGEERATLEQIRKLLTVVLGVDVV